MEQSAAPGLTLNMEVTFLFYADDLVLLSPTAQGLQQHLDLLEQYCQNWALTPHSTGATAASGPAAEILTPLTMHAQIHNSHPNSEKGMTFY